MTPNDRITIEAEGYANSHINGRAQPDVWEIAFKAHEAGTTAEHDRAQVLADALREFISYHETGLLPARHVYEKGVAALEQWKSGKGKEEKVYRPCPHCGKELFRDRNLCCRACGKEVGDE